jgi:lysozyme
MGSGSIFQEYRRVGTLCGFLALAALLWITPNPANASGPADCGASQQASIDGIPAFFSSGDDQQAAHCGQIYTTPDGIDTFPNDPTCNGALPGGTQPPGNDAGGNPPCLRTDGTGYQCTELAARYFYSRFFYPTLKQWPNWQFFDAYEMCENPLPTDSNGSPVVIKTSNPVHGDLMVWNKLGCICSGEDFEHPGVKVCGTSGAPKTGCVCSGGQADWDACIAAGNTAATCVNIQHIDDKCAGHVAVVDSVDSSGNVSSVQEHGTYQNRDSATRIASQSEAYCFLHATANLAGACTSHAANFTSGGTATAVCSDETDRPTGVTFDGYPVFNHEMPGFDPNVYNPKWKGPDAWQGANAPCDGNSVWSNDGINTVNHLPSGASPSQYFESQVGAYGYQCTELARRYFHFRWHVDLTPSDATGWCPKGGINHSPIPLPSGAQFTTTPVPGDLMVYPSPPVDNECAGWVSGDNGHVAVVNKVNNDGTVDTWNQNWYVYGSAQGVSGFSTVPAKCACAYIHATANTGVTSCCTALSASPAIATSTNTVSTVCHQTPPPEPPTYPNGFVTPSIPAFDNPGGCDNDPDPSLQGQHPVCSLDGKQTYDCNTKEGVVYNYDTQNNQWGVGAYHNFSAEVAQNPSNEYRSWWSGYVCDEYARRYFHFAHHVDLAYPEGGIPDELCPQSVSTTNVVGVKGNQWGPAATWKPQNGAAYASTPSVGDVLVFTTQWPGVSLRNPGCNLSGILGPIGPDTVTSHIAVVAKVYQKNGKTVFDTVSQNWHGTDSLGVLSGADDRGYTPECACAFIHAGSNNNACYAEPYALATYRTGPATALDGPVASPASSTGALVVFVRGTDSQLYYKAQQTPGDSESWDKSWTPINGANNMFGDPVVVTHGLITASQAPLGFQASQAVGAGEIEIFYVGTDNLIYHVWQKRDTSVHGPWSQPEQIGGPDASTSSQVTAFWNNVLFYVDSKQQIQVIYSNLAPTGQYQPGKTYTWSKPITIDTKTPGSTGFSGSLGAVSNIAAIYDPNLNVNLFYVGSDKSIQRITSKTPWQPINGGNQAAGGWNAPQTITGAAAVGAGAATSNVAATNDPSIYFRGVDSGVWGISPAPGSTTSYGQSTTPWNGTFGLPERVLGQSSSDIIPREMLGFTELFYRNGEGGLEYIKQTIDDTTNPPTPKGWDKHVQLAGTKTYSSCKNSGNAIVKHCPVTCQPKNGAPTTSQCPKDTIPVPTSQCYMGPRNTTALPYLDNGDSVFSIPAFGLNLDWRSEIFYIGGDGAVWHAYETAAPTYKQPYPGWSCPESLGLNWPSDFGPGPSTGGYNPAQVYQLDNAGVQAIENYEGYSPTCYTDSGGNLTFGYGHRVYANDVCNINGQAVPVCDVFAQFGTSGAQQCAQQLETSDLQRFVDQIKQLVKVDITQEQFDALVSLAYNTGAYGFPDLLNALNGGTPPYQQAADDFTFYIHDSAGNCLHDLYTRRISEKTTFCSGSSYNGGPPCQVLPDPYNPGPPCGN